MIGIHLENLTLQFRVRPHGRVRLKDLLIQRCLGRPGTSCIEVNALKGLNLHVREGERLGIVGHNGAGKSTLLKLLAGIYPPTTGVFQVTGRISAMLDIGVGIEPDASGWENIRYRSFLQGDTPTQVKHKEAAIAEFSELGQALDMPVRFYSSGMQVRLMFSIATAIEPEILLLDEILSAGDLSFQEKAYHRMMTLIDRARMMVLASHDLKSLSRLCTRVVWLDQGQVKLDGKPEDVIGLYESFMKGDYQAAA
jgi:ABC-type polysaccharide/polyol phosphate transport system ATPase subunit